MARQLSRSSLAFLSLLSISCGGKDAAAHPADDPAHGTASTAAVADTALLTPAAVRTAGFKTDEARIIPWRGSWATPARLELDPSTTQPIGSIVQGRVLRVLALPGDHVQRGQVLMTLHSEEMLTARNDLAKAEAGRVQAESDLRVATEAAARADRLYAGRAGALADVERARGARVDAEAARQRARAELARAREYFGHLVGEGPPPPREPGSGGAGDLDVLVRAPFAGVVVSRDVQAGEVVNIGAPLLTVGRLGTLAVVLRLPEQALGVARPGAEVQFTVPAYPGRRFTARVVRVAPALDSLSRTAEVIASVPNPTGELKAQMTAVAEVLGAQGEPVLAVSDAAVQEFQGDTIVVTARSMGGGMLLQAVKVRARRRAQGLVEIVTGLAPGSRVVTEGVGIAKAEIQRRREERSGGGGGGTGS